MALFLLVFEVSKVRSKMNKHIGELLKSSREGQGYSREALANKVGISPGYLGMIERGKRIPATRTIVRIMDILHVLPK